MLKELEKKNRQKDTSTITAEFLSAMFEDARQKIFVYKDELETKNLVQKFG